MLLADYSFELPKELIAQKPLTERVASRMLAVDRKAESFRDANFVDLPSMLRPTDVLVLNNTKVFPARLHGSTPTGARVEIFLVEESGPDTWIALARPGRRLRAGTTLDIDGKLAAEVVEKLDTGQVVVRFGPSRKFDELVDEIGRTPLPPYIQRDTAVPDTDRERYQTVFASKRGAIAAPTAGLHFSPSILDEIRGRGIETVEITLHVGYGTFEPVRAADDLTQHKVAAERFEITAAAAETLERARRDGSRIVAVGTTTTRTLEYVIQKFGCFKEEAGRADLTIVPGYRFAAVGALLTNFHLPESSLLILVATFGGHKLIMDSYRHAVSSRYRFYSYGDCMFIE